MRLNQEIKAEVEKRLGVKITLKEPEEMYFGKYSIEIRDRYYFVFCSALTPMRALEKALNLWIQYDRHTPYVAIDFMMAMLKNISKDLDSESVFSRITTEDGQMDGLFIKTNGRFKLYSFHKSVKFPKA